MASVIAYSIGVDIGINFECSKENAGNLFGLAGYFFLGPIFALVAAIFTPEASDYSISCLNGRNSYESICLPVAYKGVSNA